MSAFRVIVAAACVGIAAAASAAELPNRVVKPAAAAPAALRHCDIAGVQGVLTAGGVCVKLSGYVSAQFAAGNLKRQYANPLKP